MESKIIEVTNNRSGGINWGKFMVSQFTTEWERTSRINDRQLLSTIGWDQSHILVTDLQTGEGAIFRPGGLAAADLHKHRIWVCPLFEPFLTWLYQQDLTDLNALPDVVEIAAESALYGYRRQGPETPPQRKRRKEAAT